MCLRKSNNFCNSNRIGYDIIIIDPVVIPAYMINPENKISERSPISTDIINQYRGASHFFGLSLNGLYVNRNNNVKTKAANTNPNSTFVVLHVIISKIHDEEVTAIVTLDRILIIFMVFVINTCLFFSIIIEIYSTSDPIKIARGTGFQGTEIFNIIEKHEKEIAQSSVTLKNGYQPSVTSISFNISRFKIIAVQKNVILKITIINEM